MSRNITAEIAQELYRAFSKFPQDPELLSVIGSYGDTLDDSEILELLKDYNKTGFSLVQGGIN